VGGGGSSTMGNMKSGRVVLLGDCLPGDVGGEKGTLESSIVLLRISSWECGSGGVRYGAGGTTS